MHEMAVVTYIVDAICERAAQEGATRVVSCTLTVGVVRDIHEDLLQSYFDWFSRGTAAEGVQVVMNKVPLRYRCSECGRIYTYGMRTGRISDPWGYDLPELADNRDSDVDECGDGCACGNGHGVHALAQPHCLDHPDAQVDVVSGMELFIEEIGVV